MQRRNLPIRRYRRRPLSWEACNEQALKHGLFQHQKGHGEYVKECQAGKTPGARAASGASYEVCEARALGLGLPHGQVGHADYINKINIKLIIYFNCIRRSCVIRRRDRRDMAGSLASEGKFDCVTIKGIAYWALAQRASI